MIIIIGASKGIGQYLLKRFISEKKNVIGTYNKSMPNTSLKEHYSKVDISNLKEVKVWIKSVENKLEKITLLNCAGSNYNSFAHKADPQKWKEVIEVNLIGTFNIIHSILPYMRNNNYGRIINFSSVVAQKGMFGATAYAASKSALWGLTKSLALENATKGITVNNLNLGYFDIGMISEVPQDKLSSIIERIPMYRLGEPENIYNAIEFIRKSDYITGTNIDINGGLF